MAKARAKKKWFSIIAPSGFGNVEIGESLAFESGDLIGRSIISNLSSLGGQVRKQNVKIKFVVSEIIDNKGVTNTDSFSLVSSYVKRVARRGKTKIDDSFVIKLKDVDVRIKPLVITMNKVKSSVRKELRRGIKEFLVEYCSKKKFDDVISSLVKSALQRDMKHRLKRIYPVSVAEIRVFEKVKKS